MKRLLTLDNLLRALLVAALLATAYKGALRTADVASRLTPERFHRGAINDAENSLIMKERHYDFALATDQAVRIKLDEVLSGRTPPPGSLVCETSLRKALEKGLATRLRNEEYLALAREKLERARRLEALGWVMPAGCSPTRGGVAP